MRSLRAGRLIRGAALAALLAPASWAPAYAAPCDAPANAIVAENCLPGDPPEVWDVAGAGDPSIQGFATDISVNRGGTVVFKIDSDATDYRADIYRLGYYGGLGARHVATVSPGVALPQNQPACLTVPATGLVDCGNWAPSASWTVPANATSGVYIAKLVRQDGSPGESHAAFIVRNDTGGSALLFQTSDTTWQAYNQYGGNSLYVGAPAGRAFKVSYNRPYTTRGPTPEDWVFNAEYPMIRWLEANGYDVSYTTGVDTARRGAELLEHQVFLTVGHDEYWSGEQRANVEAALAAGVHLASFTGNEVFWKTRWETSIDGSGTPFRTLVTYKETHANAKIDPLPGVWTGTWRDPRFSPPADGNRPENALTGTIFTVNCCSYAITVPAADGKMRFWRNTNVATLGAGQTATLGPETLGYEWDEDLDNGARPAGMVRLSSTTVNVPQRLLDFGSNYGPGTATHHLVLRRHASGALAFGAGTVQWSWGLDDVHDRGSEPADVRVQQATLNLLADMGSQPATRQPGLVAATASTDTTPPSVAITVPANGALLASGTTVAIAGTATDGGGQVGAVEVSTDGGATWHPAAGRGVWSYAWLVPVQTGPVTLLARAVDDSGNLGAAGPAVTVTPGGLPDPSSGPGGPILVVTRAADPFGRYYAEILRAEGLNEFAVADVATVSAATLAAYDVVLLAPMPLSAAQVTMLTSWVTAGGNLIAMRPDAQLASLLGLTVAGTTLANAYLLVNTVAGPGVGIVGQTIQFHGTADRYALAGAASVATLYSNPATATTNPAVTLRSVGTKGGQAAAFTYDLARSVVFTRQGNPAWVGQERDGVDPVRSDDLFFGAALGNPQPDWVNLDKVAIPQADEQQRLLANLILQTGLDRKPLPRFWYLPRGLKAAVLLTGDEHGSGGMVGRFNTYLAMSPPGCSVDDWECVRASAYIFPGSPLSDEEAADFAADGFEIGIHLNTNCDNWTPALLDDFFTNQMDALLAQLPSVPPQVTHRTHCVVWSDWASLPKASLDHGIRLDTTYYYWPPDWVADRPGLFTGSGMPMRYADFDGALIDVYQAATQMTDESGQSYPATIDALLDRAIGPEGYYGVFTANMHSDSSQSDGADAIVDSAFSRDVPVVSGRQMLAWLDGRNGASFSTLTWNLDTLRFAVAGADGASGLRGMLPRHSARGVLGTITRDGSSVGFTVETVKGIEYAFFPAAAGQYVARYPVAGDSDGDGWAPPADCNNSNAAVYPDAPEPCDGLDNDCDGTSDDGFPDVGTSCGVGVGACAATGVRVCAGEGTSTVCNALPGTPSGELCDGLDNDCDGAVDETFGDLGASCTTGVGDCARTGVRVCSGDGSETTCGAVPGSPALETCDGHDNDCDGQTDEGNPGGGGACTTGQFGICAAGTRQCQGGALICVRNLAPAAETCNGVDDNCDGHTDEQFPDLGTICTAGVGDCQAAGTKVCRGDGSGTTCSVTAGTPTGEVCDGRDNDCDGQTDEGNPGGGMACATGQLGVCAAGTGQCQGGALVCVRNIPPATETCNGLDDDCDGSTDEGTGGGSCTTGLPGVCNAGTRQCTGGVLVCAANASVPEVCDSQDNDCDGTIDNGDPGSGAACTTGAAGVCAAGIRHCQAGSLACVAAVLPSAELCNTSLDEDCNGETDESGCVYCLPANSVTLATQTKRTTAKLSLVPARDRVQTKGSFALPPGLVFAPDGAPVTLLLTDGAGDPWYAVTLSAGSFQSSGSRRRFKFVDRTLAFGGVKTAQFSIGSGGATVKYAFKISGRDQPPFAAGAGSALVQVGSRCFSDDTDVCIISPSGTSIRCE